METKPDPTPSKPENEPETPNSAQFAAPKKPVNLKKVMISATAMKPQKADPTENSDKPKSQKSKRSKKSKKHKKKQEAERKVRKMSMEEDMRKIYEITTPKLKHYYENVNDPNVTMTPVKSIAKAFNYGEGNQRTSAFRVGERGSIGAKKTSDISIPELAGGMQDSDVDSTEEGSKPVIIGITGGSGSGKNFVAKELKKKIKNLGISCRVIKEKNFLHSLFVKDEMMTKQERLNYLKNYDFDNEKAVDWKLFLKAVTFLEERRPFNMPIYDFDNQRRYSYTKKITPVDLLILEGRLFFNQKELLSKCDVKIFLDTDADIMLSRRVFGKTLRGHKLPDIIHR